MQSYNLAPSVARNTQGKFIHYLGVLVYLGIEYMLPWPGWNAS